MDFLSINVCGIGGDLKVPSLKSLKAQNKINFLSVQETQFMDSSKIPIQGLWGKRGFQSESVNSNGRSGGLLCVWDPKIFNYAGSIKSQNYIIIFGSLVGSDVSLNVANVYAPRMSEAKIGFGLSSKHISLQSVGRGLLWETLTRLELKRKD